MRRRDRVLAWFAVRRISRWLPPRGEHMSEKREHPDLGWFSRLENLNAAAPRTDTQVCNYCGHIRGLHDAAGCCSKAAHLFTRRPCECTNTYAGSLYKNPLTLRDPTPNGKP